MSDQAGGTDKDDNVIPPTVEGVETVEGEVVQSAEDEVVPEGEDSDDPTQPPDGC